MSDGGSAFSQRDFYLVLGDHRTRKRCAEQVLVFVYGACFQRGEDVSGKEFFTQVLDHHLAGAGRVGFLHDCFDVVTLADVPHHRDDVVVVVLFEP